MQTKYQVFVSSTFRDLTDERQDAIRSILDLGHIPAGMELFPAADTEQLEYIKKVIDECDYYVLIMGGRYGSTDSAGVSFTEREYQYAVDTKKVVLAFVHGDANSIPVGKTDVNAILAEKLEAFRRTVMSGRLVKTWTSREQLEALVIKGLVHAMNNEPAIGWVRGNAVASEELLNQINRLRLENEELRSQAPAAKQSHPIIEGLASMESTLAFSGKWFDYGQQRAVAMTTPLSWTDILRAVGPEFLSPAPRNEIRSALARHLHEIKGWDSEAELNTSDANIVQTQLEALGLLEPVTGSVAAAGMYMLTAHGRNVLMETLAIRA